MRLFYCPECGKEETRRDNPYKNEETLINIRDGYGRPITHYKCECGNYLAGSMDVNGLLDDKGAILYCKETIEGYNRGGCYYNCDEIDLFEKAKQCYERRRRPMSEGLINEAK